MPVQENVDSFIGPALATVEDKSCSCKELYIFCSQIKEGQQQHLFNFIIKQVQQLMLNERNNLLNPHPFYIFLTGEAGVATYQISH